MSCVEIPTTFLLQLKQKQQIEIEKIINCFIIYGMGIKRICLKEKPALFLKLIFNAFNVMEFIPFVRLNSAKEVTLKVLYKSLGGFSS